MYENLKLEIRKDSCKRGEELACFIRNGYMPSWAPENRTNQDTGLQRYSTAHSWSQYQAGEIAREEALERAERRACREVDKAEFWGMCKLKEAEAAPDLAWCDISVEWVRSSTWGYNPHATIRTNAGIFTGKASGYGYDKESAAIADALNKCPSALKMLYTLKESGLEAGQSDQDKGTCTGRNNSSICGYGSGYGVLPYFEGGVGTRCFLAIFHKCGFRATESHGRHYDHYSMEKEA